ncbi:hypothetical protein J4219_08795 [Candidatus Woesearchaeota archaeon]|nr:hypothetical protein [Candidatus Woesearchaeota archaeon]
MNKTVLLIVCLILSVVGIVMIFFAKPDVSPQVLELSGTVVEVDKRADVTFITFIPDDLKVVSFGEGSFAKGNTTLRGRLQQYKGRLEFVLDD